MAHKNYVCGELLRMLRLIKGVKQRFSNGGYKISQQAMSKLERSKRVSEKKFKEIAKAYNCTEQDIETAKKLLPPPPIMFRLNMNYYKTKNLYKCRGFNY